MSYTKTNWVDGDTITAEKLNHIEAGVEAITLPDIDPVEDIGKVLTVSDTGELIWATPGQSSDATGPAEYIDEGMQEV